jgi:hypothetical protein
VFVSTLPLCVVLKISKSLCWYNTKKISIHILSKGRSILLTHPKFAAFVIINRWLCLLSNVHLRAMMLWILVGKVLIGSTTQVAVPIYATPPIIVVTCQTLVRVSVAWEIVCHRCVGPAVDPDGKYQWHWNFLTPPPVFYRQWRGKVLVVEITSLVCFAGACSIGSPFLVVCAFWHAAGTLLTSGIWLSRHATKRLADPLHKWHYLPSSSSSLPFSPTSSLLHPHRSVTWQVQYNIKPYILYLHSSLSPSNCYFLNVLQTYWIYRNNG